MLGLFFLFPQIFFRKSNKTKPIIFSLSLGLLSAINKVKAVNASGVRLARNIFAFLKNQTKAKIEENKKAELNRSTADKEIAVRSIQSRIRLWAVLLPPLPALALALFVFFWRRRRENLGVSENRMV